MPSGAQYRLQDTQRLLQTQDLLIPPVQAALKTALAKLAESEEKETECRVAMEKAKRMEKASSAEVETLTEAKRNLEKEVKEVSGVYRGSGWKGGLDAVAHCVCLCMK